MLKKVLFFIGILIFLVGCNTKFSVNGEYEETPIVHLLLDQGEEYHFLKLNKTFLQEGNAYDFAKEEELSMFDNVEAKVEEVKSGSVTRTWILSDTVIDNKANGAFYGPEQKLYYFKAADLDQDALYRLYIDIENGKHIVTGETSLVKNVSITSPNLNQSLNFADNNVQENGYKSQNIVVSTGSGAGVYKLQLRFDYEERTSSETTSKSIVWDVAQLSRSDVGSTNFSFQAQGIRFYDFLSNRIKESEEVIRRNARGVELIVTAGSEDLYTYMLASAPTSSIAQNKPVYSNVEGALGIFSSRLTSRQYKPYFVLPHQRALNFNSTKELCKGQYTYKLRFCSDIPDDVNFDFYCN